MGYTKERRLINSINGRTNVKACSDIVGNEFILPNNSGDHQKSIKRNTPLNDYDLVNKKYVDDNTYDPSTLDDDKILFGKLQQDTDLQWDGTSLKVVGQVEMGTDAAVKHLYFRRAGYNYITTNTGGSLSFATNGGNPSYSDSQLILKSDYNTVIRKGYLGLGADDPDELLHAKGVLPIIKLESSEAYSVPPSTQIKSMLNYKTGGKTYMTGLVFAKENAVSSNTGGVIKFIGKKAGAGAAECMRINSTGTLVFTQAGAGLPYAELYVNDNSTAKTIATGNTYVKMDGTLSNGSSSNCTADGTNAKITITKAGIYRINARFNGMVDTANTEVEGAIFLDGSVQSNLVCKAEFVAVNKNCSSAISGLIDCPANKDIDFRVRHDDGGSVDLTIVDANISVVMVGGT